MPRPQALTPAVLMLLLGLGLAAPAAAADNSENSQRLAIFRLEFSGNVAQPLRDSLASRLVEGLTTVGFEVIRPAAGGAVLAELRDGRCDRPDCLRTIADRLQARYLVGAKVEENAKTFEITLELVTGRTGVVTGTSRERCEILWRRGGRREAVSRGRGAALAPPGPGTRPGALRDPHPATRGLDPDRRQAGRKDARRPQSGRRSASHVDRAGGVQLRSIGRSS